MDMSMPYGLCRLTPTASGFQMTCTRPCHNTNIKCTKTRSSALAGNEEQTLRMLKAWAKMGDEYDTKDDYFAAFCRVAKAADTGTLDNKRGIIAKSIVFFRSKVKSICFDV